MKLSCTAYAFNIRKRKQFRGKDADLASLSLWWRKKRRRKKKTKPMRSVVSPQRERGEGSSSAGLRVQTGAWEVVLLLSQGLIRGSNCPVPGRERRFALPGTARPQRSLLGGRLSACQTDFAAPRKGMARAQRGPGAVPGSVQGGTDNSCEVWGIFTSSPAPAPTQKSLHLFQ